MSAIVGFRESGGTEHALVGGKGANLGRLAGAGFPVPPGFTVTTEAYRAFLAGPLGDKIAEIVADIDVTDHEGVERATADIRQLICGTPLPEVLERDLAAAMAELGAPFVAVRSSGTAEDLADSSFAGMHDTFLDVVPANVAAAVRDCWASLWTPRAAVYRQTRGFDHLEAAMAVVVQTMVEADVSGVGFTGNPLTADTTESVIDASWGLGEAVVSGSVTPDHFVFKHQQVYANNQSAYALVPTRSLGVTLRLKEKTVGSKEHKIVRDPVTGSGTVAQEVSEEQRADFSLSDADALRVAELGYRVQKHYDDLPQDIEWAIADGELYLLQSRPITGVNFAWDEDVDAWQTVTETEDAVWTRVVSDEGWTGAITPLMYSFRAHMWNTAWHYGLPFYGREDLRSQRAIKYHKGEAYLNVEHEKAIILAGPKQARAMVVNRLPKQDWDEVLASPWSALEYLKMVGKFAMMGRKQVDGRNVGNASGFFGHFKSLQDYIDNRNDEARGLTEEQVASLGDAELKAYVEQLTIFETDYATYATMPGWFIYSRDVMAMLAYLVATWYDGDNPNAFLELVTGTPKPTAALRENVELRQLTLALRSEPDLLRMFQETGRERFFEQAWELESGRAFIEQCQIFVDKNGHRGHADRDIYWPRYADDWRLLYDSLAVHLKVDDDPMEHLEANNVRRAEVAEDIMANLRKKSFGFLRVEVFKLALDYSLRFLEIRDNERWFIDQSTYSLRRAFLDMNRRVRERGLLDADDDFWFLAKEELYEVLDGTHNPRLIRAKVAGRRANWEAFLNREVALPKFLQHGGDFEAGQLNSFELGDGRVGYQGMPTSRGVMEGTARLVKKLGEIGRVHRGEIAIVHATDPGWTPIFALVSAIVAETGGMLSHCSSLAREHGLPAVQLEGALSLIPDGARIRIDGNTGQIEVLDPVAESAEESEGVRELAAALS
ncbi:PEP/pyruvate-binding domain-containing protein [Sporichthya brevicatena]|uniref:PEP/pyruvate-binding domain-containing protein n=1 Tax=Sporichthya brevicatena TaxID=171442 RepID=A0ABP3RKD0_9ACTN